MLKYLYDAKTNAFYPLSLKQAYESVDLWPEGGVDVSEQLFISFQKNPPGKIRIAGPDGAPTWAAKPEPSIQQIIQLAELEKQNYIVSINSHINHHQWPSKLALGRLTEQEKERFNEWLDYLDAVMAVDVTAAPDIHWPGPPEEQAR